MLRLATDAQDTVLGAGAGVEQVELCCLNAGGSLREFTPYKCSMVKHDPVLEK